MTTWTGCQWERDGDGAVVVLNSKAAVHSSMQSSCFRANVLMYTCVCVQCALLPKLTMTDVRQCRATGSTKAMYDGWIVRMLCSRGMLFQFEHFALFFRTYCMLVHRVHNRNGCEGGRVSGEGNWPRCFGLCAYWSSGIFVNIRIISVLMRSGLSSLFDCFRRILAYFTNTRILFDCSEGKEHLKSKMECFFSFSEILILKYSSKKHVHEMVRFLVSWLCCNTIICTWPGPMRL